MIDLIRANTGTIWLDGAGRAWKLSEHMTTRIRRTRRWVCELCDVPVTMFDIVTGTASLPRIDGDSANGYEAFHTACLHDASQAAS